MTDARLLTADRDSLEIAHEALLHSWPRLRRWIDEARDDLRTRQRIEHAAAEWRAGDHDPDLLYRGTPLQAALEWAREHGDVLGPGGGEFLAASREAFLRDRARSEEAARRSRRLRRVALVTLSGLTVAAVAASLIAFSALGESRSRYAQSLATRALAVAESDPRTAIALAVEAMARSERDPLLDARAALVDGSQALADSTFQPSGSASSVGDALSIAVDPDGAFLVTGNRDGSISTWSSMGASLASNVPGHASAIEEMDLTPDGRWLITGSDDTTIMRWDLADPTDVPPPTLLGETTGIVWSVAVAPDGTTAASASEDGTIRLWDLETRKQIGDGPFADLDGDALTVSFSPDGELLMVGNGVGEVTGWAVDDGQIAIPTFHAHRSDVWEIEFDPQGSRFATASSDQRIRVWDTETQEPLGEPFARSSEDVRGVLLDDAHVFAGDETGRLQVASTTGSGEPTTSAPRHAEQIVDAAWGGDVLATLGNDQQVQVWSRAGDPTATIIDGFLGGAIGLAASPDGARIAVGDGEGAVHLASGTTGERGLDLNGLHDGAVLALAFSEDGSRLASGGQDGTVVVTDVASGGHVAGPAPASGSIDALLWADDALLAGGADQMVRIWRGERFEGELGPHDGGVTAMALSSDGVLAVADRAGVVRFWNLEERTLEGPPFPADDNTIWALAWSPDGSILATASDDEVVELWDVASRTRIASLGRHPGGALGVAFLEDEETLVTTSRDGSVRLWDVSQALPLGGPLPGHHASSWRVVALPGMRFATSSEEGTVRIWDVLDPERACSRAAGSLGLDALGEFLGAGEEPVACVDGSA
jgi:WD40 repeat protein